MTEAPTIAVLGLRPHTYWTAAVALAGPLQAPRVLARRRIDFAAGLERFVYHQAEDMELPQAEALIAKVRATTTANAAREIAALLADLQADGARVAAAVIPAGTAKLPDDLAEILRVHARMHAAEGTFYRDMVAAGCTAAGLDVHRAAERDLPGLVAARLGLAAPVLDDRLKQMGAALGSPWSEDYRLATLAAWTRL